MIRFLSLLLALGFTAGGVAQNDLRSYQALSIRALAIDHGMANEELEETSVTYGIELGYRRQFGRIVGVKVPVRIGVIDVGEFENPLVFGGDALLQLFPLGTDGAVSPCLHGGIGVMGENNAGPDRDEFDANHQFPIGAGLNFRLAPNSWLSVQGEYRSSNQTNRDHVQAGLGYIYRLSSLDTDGDGIANREDACPTLAGGANSNGCPDIDLDGVLDADDNCPTEPGLATLNGCPDTDSDGIADKDDSCPEQAGPARFAGCPDTDEDGVADPNDDCPEEFGPPRFNGCPDADGDGLPDPTDACPEQFGPVDRDGCPAPPPPAPKPVPPAPAPPPRVITEEVQETLDYAAQAIAFETGSDRLKESSYVILAEIASILREYKSYDLRIEGHTDNVGSEETNQRLSERRADACRTFLVRAGLAPSRITARGFGETFPRMENSTAEGRRLNRRVEFQLVRR